jgi:hypothetical protein
MAAIERTCLFCQKRPWDEGEVELLNWYSTNMSGRLDTRICDFHREKQVQHLPRLRERIQAENKKRRVPPEEARQRIYMAHYREMQEDQENSPRCCIVM